MKFDFSHSLPARHWKPFNENRVECTLCPRHCRPKQNRVGFCGVRGNINNQLRTLNYGKSLAATEEVIETEAVNHYLPGARILSMGNIGCMMACSFCQNWETSQVRHLDTRVIRNYTPDEVVELCLENEISVLSWTYNDPVVWHEFVVETSRLAQAHGISTLYKSALYIEQEPLAELIDCIDIFSISLKSLSETFYKKISRGRLGPVLDGIKQIASSSRHLEISQLVIPELNDGHEDIKRTIDWVLNEVGGHVPLHFVAFHPAYLYQHVERTDVNVLQYAKTIAKAAGIKHVYLGNTYLENENDTVCEHCQSVLVRRYGLHAEHVHLDQEGRCAVCGTISPIRMPDKPRVSPCETLRQRDMKHRLILRWNKEMQSAHILQTHLIQHSDTIQIRSIGPYPTRIHRLRSGLDRFIVSRQGSNERGIVLSWESDNAYELLPVLDRAHYPVKQEASDIQIPVKLAGGMI